MLVQLINSELSIRELSIRDAAIEIGIAHTSLYRILKGSSFDLQTVGKIAAWLKVPTSLLIDTISPSLDERIIASGMTILIERNPKVGKVFREIIQDFISGKINDHDINDILSYAAYKLTLGRTN